MRDGGVERPATGVYTDSYGEQKQDCRPPQAEQVGSAPDADCAGPRSAGGGGVQHHDGPGGYSLPGVPRTEGPNAEASKVKMRPADILQVKAEVRARDGFRCTKCGMTNADHLAICGKSLEVHRVVPGSVYTLSGCITVCRSCHDQLPRRNHGEKETAEGFGAVRLESVVYTMARVISVVTKENLSDLLSEICRPVLEKRVKQLIDSGALIPARPRDE
jgi:hypothetical protein